MGNGYKTANACMLFNVYKQKKKSEDAMKIHWISCLKAVILQRWVI